MVLFQKKNLRCNIYTVGNAFFGGKCIANLYMGESNSCMAVIDQHTSTAEECSEMKQNPQLAQEKKHHGES